MFDNASTVHDNASTMYDKASTVHDNAIQGRSVTVIYV